MKWENVLPFRPISSTSTLLVMRFILGIVLLLQTMVVAAQVDRSLVEGFWMNEEQEYIVQVYEGDDHIFYGKIVWLADSLDDFGYKMRDVMNDEPEMRSRTINGLTVLYEFEFDDYDRWRSGTFYNFETGNEYNAKMRIDDEGKLNLTGYYGIFFMFSRTKEWTRITDITNYCEKD